MRGQIIKRLLAATLAAALTGSLAGCAPLTMSPEALMHPPRPTGEKADIHTVLETTAGSGITLKYPAGGDYRSAIVMHDLNDDGGDEAIAFYQKDAESVGTNIVFISEVDGEWQSLGSFSNPAAQVDKISFGDVNGDGREDVIVGWGSTQSGTGVCVYYWENGRMREWNLEQSYSQFAVMDFDDDGFSEVFTASVSVGEQAAAARLFRLRGGALEIMGETPLDAGVTRYVSVAAGLINEYQRGIVLDGSKSATLMSTEVLYWDAEARLLKSPLYDPAKQATYMERGTATVSKDINGDTIIELPVVSPLPGFEQKEGLADTAYVTDWYRYDTKTNALIPVMSMVVNTADGYWFLVPDMWRGRVTTQAVHGNSIQSLLPPRTLTFSEWTPSSKEGGPGYVGGTLLVIRAFTQKDWAAQNGAEGFFKLLDANGMVYAANSPLPDNALSISPANVKTGFKLITQDS